MSLNENFKNPGNAFRGKPFWAWNGKLEPEELRRQIEVFEKMGMGGFFMHSRVGLSTEYLGQEWFDCVDACIDEAKQRGMEAWLYDEDRWPSGAAGGLVTKDPRYQMKTLLLSVLPPEKFAGHKGLLGAWEARVEEERALELTPIKKGEKPSGKKGTKVLTFQAVATPPSPWYNGYTYLDTLSEEAVAEFIKVTHEAYKKKYKKHFGKTVPGIFTDEPNFGHFMGEFHVEEGTAIAFLPWTPKLPETFKERYGYDLRKHLPELFFDVEGNKISQARYHFRDCLTHLFSTNFTRQIGKWCDKNKMTFTGHVLFETPLSYQVWVVGSAMRSYEHMQAPGIDVLTQYNLEYDAAKQCASVAHQMGRKWVLSELYGCTGWDFPFEGHKAVGDWQAALGVTLRCQHLAWYTMAGEAKRDYPAAISHQSPWWQYYRVVEDYFSRLHTALTNGEPTRRLLVIHPDESMWLRFRIRPEEVQGGLHFPTVEPDAKALDEMITDVRNWLLEEHIDFDYGNEEMLGRLGAVKKSEGAPRLKLAKADYDAVLVPPLLTIRAGTLKLLRKFQAAGGTVIFAGEAPGAVDALASTLAAEVAAECIQVPFERTAVAQAAGEAARRVSFADAKDRQVSPVLHMLRESDKRQILFVCNTDRAKGTGPATAAVRASGYVSEWDPTTGEQFTLKARQDGEWLSFDAELPATGSRLFVIEQEKPKGLKAKAKLTEQRRQTLKLTPGTRLSEPNTLVLDRPCFKIGEGKLQGPLEILKVDQAVRDALGVPRRGGEMVQPWARKPKKHEPSLPLELSYTVQVEKLPAGPLHLILETPERFTVRVNDVELPQDCDGWWVDPCLRRLPLDPAMLVKGKNEITLTIDFKETDNLEAIFLAGQMGVRMKDGLDCTLTAPVKSLKLGDWTSQGLPFYGGSATYSFKVQPTPEKGERVILSVPEFKGSVMRVLIGGREAGFLPWPPYELDITKWAKGKELEIELELIGSRRNGFGPLHIANEPNWTGPAEFITTGKDWTEPYYLKPCGLMKAPLLSYRKAE